MKRVYILVACMILGIVCACATPMAIYAKWNEVPGEKVFCENTITLTLALRVEDAAEFGDVVEGTISVWKDQITIIVGDMIYTLPLPIGNVAKLPSWIKISIQTNGDINQISIPCIATSS